MDLLLIASAAMDALASSNWFIIPGIVLGVILLMAFAWIVAYMSVWGKRFTTQMPGGLAAALSRGAPHVFHSKDLTDRTALIFEDEHYSWVWVRNNGLGAIIRLETPKGERPQYITVLSHTKAYAEIGRLVDATETLESYKARTETEFPS